MKHIKNFNESTEPLKLIHNFKNDYSIHKAAGRKAYRKSGFKLIEVNIKNKFKIPDGVVFLTEYEASKLNEMGDEYSEEHRLKLMQFDYYVYRYHRSHYDIDPNLKGRDSGIKYEDPNNDDLGQISYNTTPKDRW